MQLLWEMMHPDYVVAMVTHALDPILFRVDTPKAAFPQLPEPSPLSVQSEKIEPKEIFSQRYSLSHNLFGSITRKELLLDFLLLCAGVYTYKLFV